MYFSPLHFILNPLLWLLLASKYHATHLQGPNFAYALLLRRLPLFKQPATLDLHTIRHIFNAAEPISVDVALQFIATFAQFGLPRHAMTGGYGLAESCVYVCDGGHGVLRVEREAFERDEVKAVEWVDCVSGQVQPAEKPAEEKVRFEKPAEEKVRFEKKNEEKDAEEKVSSEKRGKEKGAEKVTLGEKNEEKKAEPVSLFSCGDVEKNKDVIIRIVREGRDVGVALSPLPEQ